MHSLHVLGCVANRNLKLGTVGNKAASIAETQQTDDVQALPLKCNAKNHCGLTADACSGHSQPCHVLLPSPHMCMHMQYTMLCKANQGIGSSSAQHEHIVAADCSCSLQWQCSDVPEL